MKRNQLFEQPETSEELERRVAQRTAELEQANRELQITLEELRIAEAEIRSSNEELADAREALELERQRYQDLFEQAPDGYLVTDIWGKIQTANRAAAALLGVKKNYLVGKPLANYIAASERQTFRTRLAQLQEVQDWEVNLQPRKGNPFPVTIAVTSMHDSQGQLVGWRWLLHDITDRQQMQQCLQAAYDNLEKLVTERTADLSQANAKLQQEIRVSEASQRARQLAELTLWETQQQLQAIVNNSPAVIYLIDASNRHLLVNRSYAELLSATPESLISKSIYDVWSPEIADAFAANNQHVLQGDRAIEVEETAPQADGMHTYITIKFPLHDAKGIPYAICGISTDITERKQAEQKIREQAALLDVASDAIFVRDLEHRVLYWNRGAERLYGWLAAEVLGRTCDEFFNRQFSLQIEAAFKTVVEQGEWQGELNQSAKSGQEIVVQSHWTLMRDIAGQPQSILAVDTDITQKKQLEQQFYRAQRLESLGTLASGIAHDMNNILQPILTTAQLLKLKFPDADEWYRQILLTLETSAKRGADVVKQILTFARGAEGKRASVQVRHLLKDIEQLAKQTFPKSIEIKTDIPLDLWTVFADATQLHQVLMNLCVNARDAMPAGGTLSLAAANLHVDETYAQMNIEAKVGAYVAIAVADTGYGIAPEILDRIFDPFFTTKELGQGTGLGLSTVLGIVKNHGGFVQVESQVGKGSQFRVYLPAVGSQEQQQPKELELLAGKGELILIVDDEVTVQQITQTSLEAYNYKTLVASHGIEAIAFYAQHQQEIGVVLIDMMMPSMDGLTAIRTLQKMNPSVKIIATSGLASNSQPVKAAGINIQAFLSKPYTLKELLDTLNRILAVP